MKTLLSIAILTISLNTLASSETTLNQCLSVKLSQSQSTIGKTPSKDVLKALSTGIKACKYSVKVAVKAEKESKRKAKLALQIAKLQAKLSASK